MKGPKGPMRVHVRFNTGLVGLLSQKASARQILVGGQVGMDS